jgi:hypothetical protein
MAAAEIAVLSSPDNVAHTNSCISPSVKCRECKVVVLTIGTKRQSTFLINFFSSSDDHPLLQISWPWSAMICAAMSMSFAVPDLTAFTASSAVSSSESVFLDSTAVGSMMMSSGLSSGSDTLAGMSCSLGEGGNIDVTVLRDESRRYALCGRSMSTSSALSQESASIMSADPMKTTAKPYAI